jgi:DeoR/GlpR family transcriptional regulator of sugar metabolism
MKVALHVVRARRVKLARILQRHGYLALAQICWRLRISEATARRDLLALAEDKLITRTYGGALADYDRQFPSFSERRHQRQAAKREIAQAGRSAIEAGMTVFFDAGTTVHAIASAFAANPAPRVTAVTNSLPVAQVLAGVKGLAVQLVGGEFWARQSVLFGPQAQRSLRLWRFDLALLGAEGMTAAGVWNSQADIVAFQRAAATLSRRTICCLDSSKLGRETGVFLLPWRRVDGLVTDARPYELEAAGVRITPGQLVCARGVKKRKLRA